MRIGLDFDNTIVSYDELFYKVASERGLISQGRSMNKLEVRNYLRAAGKEDLWTEMQGYVYGARMEEAKYYDGVLEFLLWTRKAGHTVAIISHKTKHPFSGYKYDLHVAAKNWIENSLLSCGEMLVDARNIFFELTKAEKIKRIKSFSCDVFLDDLPEILLADDFPKVTNRVLFDPEDMHPNGQFAQIEKVDSWRVFLDYIQK